jgi:hypothetical protein
MTASRVSSIGALRSTGIDAREHVAQIPMTEVTYVGRRATLTLTEAASGVRPKYRPAPVQQRGLHARSVEEWNGGRCRTTVNDGYHRHLAAGMLRQQQLPLLVEALVRPAQTCDSHCRRETGGHVGDVAPAS